jgi:hypothetical protein
MLVLPCSLQLGLQFFFFREFCKAFKSFRICFLLFHYIFPIYSNIQLSFDLIFRIYLKLCTFTNTKAVVYLCNKIQNFLSELIWQSSSAHFTFHSMISNEIASLLRNLLKSSCCFMPFFILPSQPTSLDKPLEISTNFYGFS